MRHDVVNEGAIKALQGQIGLLFAGGSACAAHGWTRLSYSIQQKWQQPGRANFETATVGWWHLRKLKSALC